MFKIFDIGPEQPAKAFTGFFMAHPAGAFTIGRNGFGWVTNDLLNMKSSLRAGVDVAHSALIQGF